MNITSEFDALLKEKGAKCTKRAKFSLEDIDGFLREAYQVNSQISNLHSHLRDVRQAYLATAPPRRGQTRPGKATPKYLTDREREEIDATSTRMIRNLNASIRALEAAEVVRRRTEDEIMSKKYLGGLAALGSWASRGMTIRKSPEHLEAEAEANEITQHRDGVLWFISKNLEACCETQQQMMRARLDREMERNRSMLSKTEVPSSLPNYQNSHSGGPATTPAPYDAHTDFTEEQIQMFERDNQDMMSQFDTKLDQIKKLEKSMSEVSELTTVILNHVMIQYDQVEHVAENASAMVDDVDKGNKELKEAAKRPSNARKSFYGVVGFCAFLVVWDWFI